MSSFVTGFFLEQTMCVAMLDLSAAAEHDRNNARQWSKVQLYLNEAMQGSEAIKGSLSIGGAICIT